MLIALSTVWGGSFFFVAVAVESLPPFTIVFMRVFSAAIALNIISFALSGKTLFSIEWRIWIFFIGMGILQNVIPFSLIVWGQQYITGSLASILNATTPIFTMIIAHFLTYEKISPTRVAGIIAGFIGVILIIGPEVLSGVGDNLIAQLAVLGAACSYGFANVLGLKFRKFNVPSLTAATGQVTCSSLLLIPLMLLESPWDLPLPSINVWMALLGLGLLSTALAYILYFRIINSAGAVNVSLCTLLIPMVAILLGVLFLDEKLLMQHIYGMLLIGAGLIIIDGRIFKTRLFARLFRL